MNELVQTINGKAVTTSRKVAEVFGKQHRNILQAIRELEIPENYRELNFQQTVYEQPNPSGGKPIQHPEYLITRDGFTLLAMGFTGKKAMQFKIAYIEAFNAMENQLKNLPIPTHRIDIAASTAAVIEKINRQILSGIEVEPEVLRYAWNIGRLIGKTLTPSRYQSNVEEFILALDCGEYSRNEVYSAYCSNCSNPVSPRRFWPMVRQCRPFAEKKKPYCRLVVF